ncbi:VarC.1 [Listeria ivanovii FSL F6-596]|nr:VarC.1 [Listeria ivanovii FSL F6-596]
MIKDTYKTGGDRNKAKIDSLLKNENGKKPNLYTKSKNNKLEN